MSGLNVRRWTKDDKDRLYVKATVEGEFTSVGYVDAKTGFTRSTHPDFSHEQIYDAAATYAIRNSLGLPAMRAEQRRDIVQHNEDISKNKAGKSVKSSSGTGLVSRLTGKKDSWQVGAKGESKVGKLLDKARDLKVLHSVVVNEYGADIDHIVFSEHGIYTINTKSHYGATISVNTKGFFVNGKAVSHVKKAKIEAERVSQVLSRAARHQIPVTPMIAIVGTDKIKITVNTGILIVPEDQILSTIRARGTSLGKSQVDWLYERASKPSTWAKNN